VIPGGPLPCPYLVGEELCSKTSGHRGRHKSGRPAELPEISARRLARLNSRYHAVLAGQPGGWWQLRPRCPACRAVITGLAIGVVTGPNLVQEYGATGPCVVSISEYPVTFDPCGHQFRRVIRAGNIT